MNIEIEKYGHFMGKLIDIIEDQSVPIEVRERISECIIPLHLSIFSLFKEYVFIKKRLSLYEHEY